MGDHHRGQTLVEFSIVLPLFALLLLTFFDGVRVIWAQNAVAAAAREAARYAIVHGGSASDACPVGPPSASAIIPVASLSCPYPSPSKESVKQAARDAAIGTAVTVSVCYGTGCSGDDDAAGASNARGTPVTVSVETTISLVAPSLLGFRSYSVNAASTMLVNH